MEKRFMKRVSLFLCAVMILTAWPLSVFAAEDVSSEETSGNGGYEYVIPMQHDQIMHEKDAKRFVVRDNNREVLYDESGRRLSEDYAYMTYLPEENHWIASKDESVNGKQLILDNDGKVINFNADDSRLQVSIRDNTVVLLDLPYQNAAEWWKTYTGDVHVYDYSGNLLSSFSYQDHKNIDEPYGTYDVMFTDGMYAFRNSDDLCGVIDKYGRELIAPKYSRLEYMANGYFMACIGEQCGVIDKNGNTIVDCTYDAIQSWQEADGGKKTVNIIYKDGKWGIMDNDFRVLAEPRFTEIEACGEFWNAGFIKVRGKTSTEKYGLLSTDGKVLLDCRYDAISDPSEGRIAVRAGKKWAYFDYQGRQITGFVYSEAMDFSDGLAFVKGEKTGFIDQSGRMIVDVNLEGISIWSPTTLRFSEGLAGISDANGKASRYIDKSGNTVIQPKNGEKWTVAGAFYDGFAEVFGTGSSDRQGKAGVIRYTGDTTEKPSDWAADDVDEAIQAGIVPKELQKQYRSAICREDFCELAAALLQKHGKTLEAPDDSHPNPFTDTDNRCVYALNRLGIIDGRGGGIFDPDASITRQEAAKILSKTADVLGLARIEIYYEYADSSAAGTWALPFISDVYCLGVMQGVGENRFDPQGTYTTEQSIITMLRLHRQMTV